MLVKRARITERSVSLFACEDACATLTTTRARKRAVTPCASTVELTTAICLGFAAAVLVPYYIKNEVGLAYLRQSFIFWNASWAPQPTLRP